MSPIAGLLLPGRELRESSFAPSVDDFAIRFEKAACLFYELLQEGKIRNYDTSPSGVPLVKDIVKFIHKEKYLSPEQSLMKEEKSTMTIFTTEHIDHLYVQVQEFNNFQLKELS